ncbi:MAG: hypothetical protein GY841_12645 [FCB group bacterium]|nr:hypothetical protein [FCB group bacterium]
MKKSVLLALLIIILVSVTWMSDGFAQTGLDQKEVLEEWARLKQQPKIGTPSTAYESPAIFEEEIPTTPNVEASTAKPEGLAVGTRTQQQLVLPLRSKVDRYGQNLFTNPQVAEINTSLIPESYILGPGDNIIISLWGRVQQEWNLTIDRQGKIFIPKVGEITAWGMTLDQFTERLDAGLSKVYTGYKKRVTLGKIRTIKVFIYGEVNAPGGYAVSALSTLFNALYMAGGPAPNGSFRKIRLLRDNQPTVIDLYDFLITGDKSCDLPLQSGDVIFVPLVGAQAITRGEVKRPAIYELVGGEKIPDLIELAGGLTADAYLGRLMLDRISRDDAREIFDVDFTLAESQDLEINDGDDLSIFSIYQMRHNIVWVNGMVKHPGTFERTEGMTAGDLLKMGQLLPNNVFRDRADLYRHYKDGRTEIIPIDLNAILADNTDADFTLDDLDSLYIYSTDEVHRVKHVYIDGKVRNPQKHTLYDNMTIADLIFLSGNLVESAYLLSGELARIDSLGQTSIINVPLTLESGSDRFMLQENDHLFVRKIPGYQIHRTVIIEGEVKFPGQYSLTHREETFHELLQRAGGFTNKAFAAGTVFQRKSIVDDLLRRGIPNIIKSSQPMIADSTGILLTAKTPDMRPESMDRIIIDVDRIIATGGAEGDFQLQAGDNIFIPQIPTGISVLGEACANGTIKFELDKKVKNYLELAGGFTNRADRGATRLVKADGRVFAYDNTLNRRVEMGDVIVVPAEIKKERNWFKYITAGASIITGVATTVLIIDRLQ